MTSIHPQLLIVAKQPQILQAFVDANVSHPVFSSVSSIANTDEIHELYSDSILLIHESVCDTPMASLNRFTGRYGLIFDTSNNTPCVLVGNVKPEYILCMDVLEEDFPDFCRNILRQKTFYTDEVVRLLVRNAPFKFLPSDFFLGALDIQILTLMVIYGRQKDVCEHLGMHRNTLQYQIKQIEKKLGCHDIIQCIYIAQQQSWIPGDLIELKKGDVSI